MVCKDAKTLALLETSDSLKKRYQEQAALAPNSFILTALNIAADCDINYKMARHKRLHVEMAVIKMTYIGRAIELSQNPVTVGAEKKTPKINNAPVATPKSVAASTATPVKVQAKSTEEQISPPAAVEQKISPPAPVTPIAPTNICLLYTSPSPRD